MSSDQVTRWVLLLVDVLIAGLGSYATAQAAGGKGFATWGPAVIAALMTIRAGLRRSPSGPVEVTVENPPSQPVPTKEEKP